MNVEADGSGAALLGAAVVLAAPGVPGLPSQDFKGIQVRPGWVEAGVLVGLCLPNLFSRL